MFRKWKLKKMNNITIERIKEVLTNSEYSYRELEKMTNISKSTLSRYAKGQAKKIPVKAVKAIANATGVSSMYLMGWDDKMYSGEKDSKTNNLTFSELIGIRIKNARHERNMTKQELAEKTNITVERLNDMEAGINHVFDKELMVRFSNALNVDTSYFINDKILVNDISANMKCIREISGRTLEDLIEKSNVSRQRCVEIDNGSQPTLNEISKFAAYYKIPEQWIINFDFKQICKDNRVKLGFYILSLTEEISQEQLTEFKHYLNYILKR